jgi:4-hydroxybenzoate polyprenyltransferase
MSAANPNDLIMRNSWILPYFRLMRLPALFSAISNILAAHLIVTQGQVQWDTLLLLILASACFYSGGMVMNDYFDYEEDRRDRPSRPIPAGQISLRKAKIFGISLLAAGLLLAAMVGTKQLAIALVLLILIVTYDALLKNTFLGAPTMGACRLANWLLGLSIVELIPAVWSLALPIFFYISSLTLLSRVETTAKSKAPVYACAAGMLLTTGVIMILNGVGILPHGWALVLIGMGLLIILQHLQSTLKDFTPARIQGAVTVLLLGVVPLDATLVLAGGPWWGSIIVISLWLLAKRFTRLMAIT